MGIKYIEAKKNYEVSYSRRHPVTKNSMGIKRTGIKTMEEAKRTFNGLIILMEKKNKSVDVSALAGYGRSIFRGISESGNC